MMAKMLMAALGAVALSACMTVPAPAAAERLTAQDVIDRHLAAIGGSAAVAGLQSVAIVAEVAGPGFRLTSAYRATRDGRLRVDVFAGGGQHVFSHGIDDQGGWQRAGSDTHVSALGAAQQAELKRSLEYGFFGLHDLAARGHGAALSGPAQLGGTDYHVVTVTRADGRRSDYYVNAATWMIERVREPAALPSDTVAGDRADADVQADPQRGAPAAETIYSGHRDFCGILMPMASATVDLATGEETQRTQAHRAACNQPEADLSLSRTDRVVAPALAGAPS